MNVSIKRNFSFSWLYFQQVAEDIYEEIDPDEKLNLGITLTPAMPSDLLTATGSISLPITSPKLIKQEENTTDDYVEVRFLNYLGDVVSMLNEYIV